MLTYKAMYKFLDQGVHAEVLDFPGTITFGATLEEARRLLASALVLKVDRMSGVLTLPAAMGAVQLSVADGSPFGLLAGQSDAGGLCPTPTPTLA